MKKQQVLMFLLASSVFLGFPAVAHAETTDADSTAVEQSETVGSQTESSEAIQSDSAQNDVQSSESESEDQATVQDTTEADNGEEGTVQDDSTPAAADENTVQDNTASDSSATVQNASNEVTQTGFVKDSNGRKYYYYDGTLAKGVFYAYDPDSQTDGCYYADQDGYISTTKGWFEVKNTYGSTTYATWYYGNGDGTLKKGWFQDTDGQYYYLFPGMASGSFYTNDEDKGCFVADQSGHVYNKKGWFAINSTSGNYTYTSWYYGDGNWHVKTGWFQESGNWYYLYPSMATGRFSVYDDKTQEPVYYRADKDGHVYNKKGWFYDTNEAGYTSWYYGDGNWHDLTGWQKLDGKRYYFDPYGGSRFGFTEIENKKYHFSYDGSLDYGWYLDQASNCWGYSDSDGIVLTDQWMKGGSDWYYFDSQGRALTNTFGYEYVTASEPTTSHIDYTRSQEKTYTGKLYLFNQDGKMEKGDGWKNIEHTSYSDEGEKTDISWYYTNQDGTLYQGWKSENGFTYYLNPSMESNNYLEINGKTYLFDANGHMIAGGWYYFDYYDDVEPWFYLKSNGEGYDGWLNDTYYILNGHMLTDTYTPDGYFVDESGVWDKTIPRLNAGNGWSIGYDYGTTYVTNDSKSGWVSENNVWYYIDPEYSTLVRGIREIDGKAYAFNRAGIWLGYIPDGWYQDYYGDWYVIQKGKLLKDQWYQDIYYLGSDGCMVEDGTITTYRDSDNKVHTTEVISTYDKVLSVYGTDENGRYFKGWSENSWDRWRYSDPKTGLISSGWKVINGKWYYLNARGEMATGLTYDNKDRCYFIEEDGSTLRTGWTRPEYYSSTYSWYYYDSNGEGHDGDLYYNGKYYYLDKGLMKTNYYHGAYWYGRDGVAIAVH